MCQALSEALGSQQWAKQRKSLPPGAQVLVGETDKPLLDHGTSVTGDGAMGKGWQGRGMCVRKGERDALHTVAREGLAGGDTEQNPDWGGGEGTAAWPAGQRGSRQRDRTDTGCSEGSRVTSGWLGHSKGRRAEQEGPLGGNRLHEGGVRQRFRAHESPDLAYALKGPAHCPVGKQGQR